MDAFADSIGAFAWALFRWSSVGFVVVNAAAVAAFAIRRDRLMVNRWTPRLLVANLLLAGSGLGIPIAAQAMKLVVKAVSTSQISEINLRDK